MCDLPYVPNAGRNQYSIGYLMNLPTPKQESVSENTHASPVISTFCWCYPANFQPRHQQFHACCIESAPLCSSKCHKPGRNTGDPGKICNKPRFFSDVVGFLDDVGTSVSSCVKIEDVWIHSCHDSMTFLEWKFNRKRCSSASGKSLPESFEPPSASPAKAFVPLKVPVVPSAVRHSPRISKPASA